MVEQRRRTWRLKFADAFRGLYWGAKGQSSFVVHLPATIAVLAVAGLLRVSRLEWAVLILCIALVLVAEWFNSALEYLGRALERNPNPLLGRALDIASGAVLMAALGAAVAGAVILLPHLLRAFVSPA